MAAKVNFIVKTIDGKAAQIKKALTDAGVNVRAVVEVYREEEKPPEDQCDDAPQEQ